MPTFLAERCMDCGGCVGVCPHDALDLFEKFITVRDTCTECNLCVQLCPVDALASTPGSPVKGLPRLARSAAEGIGAAGAERRPLVKG